MLKLIHSWACVRACVCLFTGLLVFVCVCLSRFSLFSPHLIERCHLFVSWCSSLCSLFVAPQEACRSHYSPKSTTLLSTLGFFSINTSNLKTKKSPWKRRKNELLRRRSACAVWFCQKSFQLVIVKNWFLQTHFRAKENRTLCSQPRTQNCASSGRLRWGSGVTFHLN